MVKQGFLQKKVYGTYYNYYMYINLKAAFIYFHSPQSLETKMKSHGKPEQMHGTGFWCQNKAVLITQEQTITDNKWEDVPATIVPSGFAFWQVEFVACCLFSENFCSGCSSFAISLKKPFTNSSIYG